MSKVIAIALFAVLVISTAALAAKPVQAEPTITPGTPFEQAFGGTVDFDVTGLNPRQGRNAQVDVQCYGYAAGAGDRPNVGWWDTKAWDASTFVLGSDGTVAPPDLGSVIYLSWGNFGNDIGMECTARLFTADKKGNVKVLDTYGPFNT